MRRYFDAAVLFPPIRLLIIGADIAQPLCHQLSAAIAGLEVIVIPIRAPLLPARSLSRRRAADHLAGTDLVGPGPRSAQPRW